MYTSILFTLFATFSLFISDNLKANSFETIKQLALKQSIETQRANLQLEQSNLSLEIANYEYWPKLGVSATILDKYPHPKGNSTQTKNQSYDATLSGTIYDFGRTAAKIEQAEYQAKLKTFSAQEINDALVWKLARSYLNFLSAKRLVKQSQENFQLSENKFISIRDNYKKGLRPENDFISAQTSLGETKLALERSQIELSLQQKQLELLIGSSLDQSNIAINISDSAPTASDLKKFIEIWDKNEKSIEQQRREVELQSFSANEQAVDATYWPKLTGQLSAQKAGSWEKTDQTYTAQVQLSWDIPYSGIQFKQKKLIVLQKKVLETEEKLEERKREDVYQNAFYRFNLTEKLSLAVDNQQKLRSRQYQLIKSRYEVGKATALELSNAELELGNGRLEQIKISNTLAQCVLDIAESKKINNIGIIFQ